MKKIMEIKELQSYEVIINKHIEEVNSDAYLLKHNFLHS